MRRYFATIWTLCVMLTKRWFRDPTALFFTFLFPLLFLFVFGSLFRDTDVSFDVAVLNRSDSQFATQLTEQLEQSDVFTIKKDTTSLDEAKEQMDRGELASIIVLPEGFGNLNENGVPGGHAQVFYEDANPQTGQTVAGIVQQQLDGFNDEFADVSAPLAVEQQATTTSDINRFDYVFSGLMGFTILTLAIFGMANGFPADKKTGSLRRLRATPLRASQLVLATALEYMLIGLLSLALMFLVGTFLFDFQMRGNYLTLLVFSIIGIFALFGFGLAIGGWAKNENQSAPLSNLVALPMMFLSGVFFPVFLMPDFLQTIANLLPLTAIIDGIRLIVTEDAGLLELGSELGLAGLWIVVIYAIAFKVFRWE